MLYCSRPRILYYSVLSVSTSGYLSRSARLCMHVQQRVLQGCIKGAPTLPNLQGAVILVLSPAQSQLITCLGSSTCPDQSRFILVDHGPIARAHTLASVPVLS